MENNVNSWQLIDTAPTDGTEVLIWTGTERLIAFYVNSKNYEGWTTGWETANGYDIGFTQVRNLTHWQPLPDPPNFR